MLVKFESYFTREGEERKGEHTIVNLAWLLAIACINGLVATSD